MSYRPVLPHGLIKEASESDFNYAKHLSNDVTLKLGVILKTIEIEDEENRLKIAPEYTVMTVEDENITIYDNCILAEGFGNAADFFTAKLRQTKDIDKTKKSGSLTKQDGAIVLLLCLKGKSEQGVILKTMAHPNRKKVLTKEAGIHMEGEYNGINWQVNKDGELTITFKSASSLSNGDVQYSNELAGGSFVKFDKTGSIDINDGESENIKIDKLSKTVEINADSDISNTTGGDFIIEADGDIDLQATKDLLVEAQGKADILIKKDMNLEITKIFKGKALMMDFESEMITKLKTRQMMIEADLAQMKIKQTLIQGSMFIVQAPQILLGNSVAPALTMKTKFIGTGNAGLPVISQAMGPYSPGVFIAT